MASDQDDPWKALDWLEKYHVEVELALGNRLTCDNGCKFAIRIATLRRLLEAAARMHGTTPKQIETAYREILNLLPEIRRGTIRGYLDSLYAAALDAARTPGKENDQCR